MISTTIFRFNDPDSRVFIVAPAFCGRIFTPFFGARRNSALITSDLPIEIFNEAADFPPETSCIIQLILTN